jgi:hypothetical protein
VVELDEDLFGDILKKPIKSRRDKHSWRIPMKSRALSFILLATLVGCVSPSTNRNPASDALGNRGEGGENARVSVDGTVFPVFEGGNVAHLQRSPVGTGGGGDAGSIDLLIAARKAIQIISQSRKISG